MPDQNATSGSMQSPPPPELPIVVEGSPRTGAIRSGSFVIGAYEGRALVLDLGWCRMAGVDIRILDDKMKGDNHRGGVAFERLAAEEDA